MLKETQGIARQNNPDQKKPLTFWRRHRAHVFQGYLVGAVILFLGMAVLAKTVAYFTFDVAITHAVQMFRPFWFDALMDGLSWVGFSPQATVISAVVIVFLFVCRLIWEGVVTLVSLVGSEALGLGIKSLVDRPRPSADLVNVVNQLHDYSFPSGHVLYATTFIGFLLFLTYILLKSSWWRNALLAVLGVMIAFMGPSRIYEGQHWTSDVLGAYLLGSVWLSASILIYLWGKPRFFAKPPVEETFPSPSGRKSG